MIRHIGTRYELCWSLPGNVRESFAVRLRKAVARVIDLVCVVLCSGK